MTEFRTNNLRRRKNYTKNTFLVVYRNLFRNNYTI